MNKLLAVTMSVFLILSTMTFAQSFKDRVILPPDVAFVWNFQRGGEELYRFMKFSSPMRVSYSLELMERRIGEMEVLIAKNKTNLMPIIETEYETEVEKIVAEFNYTDLFSTVIDFDIKENVTQRMQYDIVVLNKILTLSQGVEDHLNSAIKKTSICIAAIDNM